MYYFGPFISHKNWGVKYNTIGFKNKKTFYLWSFIYLLNKTGSLPLLPTQKPDLCPLHITMYVSGTYYCDGGGNCSALFMDACENTVVYKCPHEHCVQELRSQLCVPMTRCA